MMLKMNTTIKIDDTISLELIDFHHAGPLYQLVKENRSHLRVWLPWVDYMRTPEDFKRYIDNSKQRYANHVETGYIIMANDSMIGRIGVYNIDMHNKHASIGYWLDQQWMGKGIITNACKAVITLAFKELGLNRIEIRCGTENYKSQAIAERLGFKKEGIIRQGEFVNSRFIDLLVYAVLKEEWMYLSRTKY
jgi:ribosomal-protein-serine acetyltransferase